MVGSIAVGITQFFWLVTWDRLTDPWTTMEPCSASCDPGSELFTVYADDDLSVILSEYHNPSETQSGYDKSLHLVVNQVLYHLGETMFGDQIPDRSNTAYLFEQMNDGFYRVATIVGANAVDSFIIRLDNGLPVRTPSIGGHIHQFAATQQGSILEIISSSGTFPTTIVYRVSNEYIEYLHLSNLMKPNIVYLDQENNVFRVFDGYNTRNYRLHGKHFLIRSLE